MGAGGGKCYERISGIQQASDLMSVGCPLSCIYLCEGAETLSFERKDNDLRWIARRRDRLSAAGRDHGLYGQSKSRPGYLQRISEPGFLT